MPHVSLTTNLETWSAPAEAWTRVPGVVQTLHNTEGELMVGAFNEEFCPKASIVSAC